MVVHGVSFIEGSHLLEVLHFFCMTCKNFPWCPIKHMHSIGIHCQFLSTWNILRCENLKIWTLKTSVRMIRPERPRYRRKTGGQSVSRFVERDFSWNFSGNKKNVTKALFSFRMNCPKILSSVAKSYSIRFCFDSAKFVLQTKPQGLKFSQKKMKFL